MKKLSFYQKLDLKTEDDIFDFLISNLKPSNRIWSYFVNWEKVFTNTKEIELDLNIFNYLIGADDFDKEFMFLLKKYPDIAKVIPALVVSTGNNAKEFKILVDHQNKKLVYDDYDFSKENLSDEDIKKYLHFVEKTGLKDLIATNKIKNLVDYMIGVEAGLDSNGRKNRGGDVMEEIVEAFIKDICNKNNFKYLKEADSITIKNKFDYDVPVDKLSRRYDFVIYNGEELFIIETNFYGGGGSKLKSTAGEYRDLFNVLDGKYKFLWITDGMGWKTAVNPLRETFDHIDYLFNLEMLENNILEAILK